MLLDDLAGDCKAKPKSIVEVLSRWIDLVETVENKWQIGVIDSAAAVSNAAHDARGVVGKFHTDSTANRCKFQCIVNQVEQSLC